LIRLSDEQKARYFQRCFTAVDGLWFMKMEERYDFPTALETDKEVWKVLAKIQARTIKSLTGLGNGFAAFKDALETKLSIEDYVFEIEMDDDGESFTLLITQCPWFNMMVKAGRERLAEKVGAVICETEYPVWAAEFGEGISFTMEGKLCGGGHCCIMKFSSAQSTVS